MENPTILTLPVTEGMTLASRIIKAGFLASRSGKKQPIISYGIKHGIFNGKPYWFTEDDRQKFQTAVRQIGAELMLQSLKPEPDTPESDPWCGGKDWVEKFHTLRNRICMPYLFEQAGFSKIWYENRISKKSAVTGKFTDEQIATINRTLHSIALTLCSLEFVEDEKGGEG